MRRRLALLQRCVAPVVAHYTAIIPPQHGYGIKLDKLERRMVSAAMANTRLTIEPWVTFVRRSARQSSLWIEQNSNSWSRTWFQRSVKWADHLERDATQQRLHYSDNVLPVRLNTRWSWAAAMYSHRDSTWFLDRRVFLEGQLGRRACAAGREHERLEGGSTHASMRV